MAIYWGAGLAYSVAQADLALLYAGIAAIGALVSAGLAWLYSGDGAGGGTSGVQD